MNVFAKKTTRYAILTFYTLSIPHSDQLSVVSYKAIERAFASHRVKYEYYLARQLHIEKLRLPFCLW